MTIGERLREERERLGLSQPKFAALVSTTKQTLFSWETGKTAPDGFQLAALAAAGVDVLYILTGQSSSAVLQYALSQDPRELAATASGSLGIYQAAKQGLIPGIDPGALAHQEAVPPVAELTETEQMLVQQYRSADDAGKKAIMLAASGIASGMKYGAALTAADDDAKA